MMKKCLVLGGTGTIGSYVVPELLKLGYAVDVTSRSRHSSGNEHLSYIHGNARDSGFLREILRNKYDAIIDFMVYGTDEFQGRHQLLLENTKHYVFTSSARVFAESKNPITEHTPRLLDTCKDKEYLKTDEYALAKARQENILRKSKYQNWTIIRPTIAYGHGRFQLGTLEANTVVFRSLQNCPVILPGAMMSRTTTMTWSGDVGKMIAKIVLNKRAFADDFNLATAEARLWKEIADYYGNLIGLRVKTTSLEQYIEIIGNEYQIKYARMFNRRFNNTKILQLTGLKQDDLMSLYNGLKNELTDFVKNPRFGGVDYTLQARLDKITRAKIDLSKASPEERKAYETLRFPRKTQLRRVIRPRTRIKHTVRRIKHKTRIRTRIRGLIKKFKRYRNKLQSYRNTTQLRKINNSPDGAILTIIDYSNYGNILQRFALQNFLDKNGYKFVSYEHDLPKNSVLSQEKFINIAEFVNKHIARRKYKNSDDFPVYIVGSDQVWRNWEYDDEYRDLGLFFFNFVQKPHKKLIAYAVSFGKGSARDAGLSRKFLRKIKPYVQNMSFISAREESGITIIKQEWGVKADLTIDPTLLLEARDYDKVINESSDKHATTAGVFAYMLGPNEQNTKLINTAAQFMQVSSQIICPYMQQESLPSVTYWLKSVRDARLVITDSFHCTVLAILNNTPFIVVENARGGVSRITNLLAQFGIEGRFVAAEQLSSLDIANLQPIGWGRINRNVDRLRKDSADWLLNAVRSQ